MGIIDFINNQVASYGFTLSQLQKKTDIDPAYLSRIFNKHISPSSKIIDKLLVAVNINCEEMLKKPVTSVDLIGEVHSFDGVFIEKKPQKINMHPSPNSSYFLVLVKAPPITRGIDFPSGFLMAFSKVEKAKDGDRAFVVFKEKGKTRKIIRKIHFNGSNIVLTSVSSQVFDIVIPKKNIIEMYRMIRMIKML